MRQFYLVLILFMFSAVARADGDDGLYEDIAPPGSTFVRVINTDAGADETSASIQGFALESLKYCSASTYVFLPAGQIAASIGDVNNTFNLDKGKFYTIVRNNKMLTVIEDTYFNNRRKALVSLYNFLSPGKLDLSVNKGAVKVIEGVEFGTKGEREINAVKVEMEVFGASQVLTGLGAQILTRGDVFSVFACGDSQSPLAQWVKWQVKAAS